MNRHDIKCYIDNEEVDCEQWLPLKQTHFESSQSHLDLTKLHKQWLYYYSEKSYEQI